MGDKSIPKSRSANLLNQKTQIKKTQKKTKIRVKWIKNVYLIKVLSGNII